MAEVGLDDVLLGEQEAAHSDTVTMTESPGRGVGKIQWESDGLGIRSQQMGRG